MNKTAKIITSTILLYVLNLIIVLVMTLKYNWSWWWLFWLFVIPLIIGLSIYLALKFKDAGPKKEKIEPEKNKTPINEVKDFVKEWIINDEDMADNCVGEMQIEPYTPKQEGHNKVSMYKLKVKRYWAEDLLFLATPIDKLKISMYHPYQIENEESEIKAEADFKERIDKSVIDPEKKIEIVDTVEDSLGNVRTVKRSAPTKYLQAQQEKKIAKEEEEEEGVEEE